MDIIEVSNGGQIWMRSDGPRPAYQYSRVREVPDREPSVYERQMACFKHRTASGAPIVADAPAIAPPDHRLPSI